MHRLLLASLLSAAAVGFPACAVPAAEGDAEGDVAQSEDALALASLVGAWQSQAGAFSSLTFTVQAATALGGLRGRRFEGSIGRVPVSGVYKLTHGTQLTLAANAAPSRELAATLGEYGVKMQAGKLTLTRRSDHSIVQTLEKATVHSPAELLAAAEAHAWPVRDPDAVYRTFETRAAAEAWGKAVAGSRWLARDGETATATRFVFGANDLWWEELEVDKTTLAITVTGEH